MSSAWSHSLRSLALPDDASPDSDSDLDFGNPSGTYDAPVSADAQLVCDLDLSARADEAEYRPNPWSIARINATVRGRNTDDAGATDSRGGKGAPRKMLRPRNGNVKAPSKKGVQGASERDTKKKKRDDKTLLLPSMSSEDLDVQNGNLIDSAASIGSAFTGFTDCARAKETSANISTDNLDVDLASAALPLVKSSPLESISAVKAVFNSLTAQNSDIIHPSVSPTHNTTHISTPDIASPTPKQTHAPRFAFPPSFSSPGLAASSRKLSHVHPTSYSSPLRAPHEVDGLNGARWPRTPGPLRLHAPGRWCEDALHGEHCLKMGAAQSNVLECREMAFCGDTIVSPVHEKATNRTSYKARELANTLSARDDAYPPPQDTHIKDNLGSMPRWLAPAQADHPPARAVRSPNLSVAAVTDVQMSSGEDAACMTHAQERCPCDASKLAFVRSSKALECRSGAPTVTHPPPTTWAVPSKPLPRGNHLTHNPTLSPSPRHFPRDAYATHPFTDADEEWCTLPPPKARRAPTPARARGAERMSGRFHLPLILPGTGGGGSSSSSRHAAKGRQEQGKGEGKVKRRVVTYLPPPLHQEEHQRSVRSSGGRDEDRKQEAVPHASSSDEASTKIFVDTRLPSGVLPNPASDDATVTIDQDGLLLRYPDTRRMIFERKRLAGAVWDLLGLASCGEVYTDRDEDYGEATLGQTRRWEVRIVLWNGQNPELSELS